MVLRTINKIQVQDEYICLTYLHYVINLHPIKTDIKRSEYSSANEHERPSREERKDFSMKRLFEPRSIAVIGASNDAARIGAMPIRFLMKSGYSGKIYPVNPKHEEIFGLRCYPSLAGILSEVDLVLMAIQKRFVPDALRDCASKKVPYVILFTAGYSETGQKGKKEQEDLLGFAQESKIRLIGPNCIGIVSLHNRLTASFLSGLDAPGLIPGPIAVITQSGGICNAILTKAADRLMGLGTLVSTGNELDMEAVDFIDYFIEDPGTSAIALLIESVKRPAIFIRAADRAIQKKKPLVVLKVGRSAAGSKAAASHTGAMTGSYAVHQGLFRQKGICQVSSVDELLEVTHLLSRYGARGGHRLAVLSSSGGMGALMADLAEIKGLHLPAPSAETCLRLKNLVPQTGSMGNPMDTTSQYMNDSDAFDRYLRAFNEADNCDVLVVVMTLSPSEKTGSLALSLVSTAETLTKPLVICWPVGFTTHETFRHIQKAGIPLFFDPERCISALAHFARYGVFRKECDPRTTVRSKSGNPV
jgi:acetate---CoA ligase (ADP-forming)